MEQIPSLEFKATKTQAVSSRDLCAVLAIQGIGICAAVRMLGAVPSRQRTSPPSGVTRDLGECKRLLKAKTNSDDSPTELACRGHVVGRGRRSTSKSARDESPFTRETPHVSQKGTSV